MRKLMLSSAVLGTITLVAPFAYAQTATTPPADTTAPAATTAPATPAPAAVTPAAPATATVTVPAAATPIEGYAAYTATTMTVEELEGANVYDTDANHIGSISDAVISADGQIERVVASVGGMLGIGATEHAFNFDQLHLLREVDGETLAVQVPMTREQIDALPAYEAPAAQ